MPGLLSPISPRWGGHGESTLGVYIPDGEAVAGVEPGLVRVGDVGRVRVLLDHRVVRRVLSKLLRRSYSRFMRVELVGAVRLEDKVEEFYRSLSGVVGRPPLLSLRRVGGTASLKLAGDGVSVVCSGSVCSVHARWLVGIGDGVVEGVSEILRVYLHGANPKLATELLAELVERLRVRLERLHAGVFFEGLVRGEVRGGLVRVYTLR